MAFTGIKNGDKKWFNSREAAVYLSISEAQLRNLVSLGKVPYYKLGRSNRYLRDELDNLLLSNRGEYYDNSKGR